MSSARRSPFAQEAVHSRRRSNIDLRESFAAVTCTAAATASAAAAAVAEFPNAAGKLPGTTIETLAGAAATATAVATNAAATAATTAAQVVSTSVQLGSDASRILRCPMSPPEEITTSRGGFDGYRGIFHSLDSFASPTASRALSDAPSAVGNRIDFRARLELLLNSAESSKQQIAQKLFHRFQGRTASLLDSLQILQDKWHFPEWAFPMIWVHVRRAAGNADIPNLVTEDQWLNAFTRWLLALSARCCKTRVSRQLLVQTRALSDLERLYLRGGVLGSGKYGEVSLALHKRLGTSRVMKTVNKSQIEISDEQIIGEVDMLKSLDHPHIIRIFECFETEEELHIVMDHAEGGDLARVIQSMQSVDMRLPEGWVCRAAHQIVCALAYMHSKGVLHCDLKPANIMLLQQLDPEKPAAPHVLLADFGLAELLEESRGSPVAVKGTPAYLSPEGYEGHLTQKSDMWALGVTVFEMLLGRKPFAGGSNLFLFWSLVAKTEVSLSELSAPAQGIVGSLLAKDPMVRPTAAECRLHPWFTKAKVPEVSHEGTHLQFFSPMTFVQRAAAFYIAAGLGMKELRVLRDMFESLDADCSGTLTIEELTNAVQGLGITESPEALFAAMDLDQNGTISYTEFLAGALHANDMLSEQMVRFAFDTFDLNEDGFISKSDLQRMFSANGPMVDVLPDGTTIEEIMDQVASTSNYISFADFKSYLQRVWDSEPLRCSTPRSKANSMIKDLSFTSRHTASDASTKDEAEKDGRGEDFPEFHRWLDNLLKDTKQGAEMTPLLLFGDPRLEAAYVAHHLSSTCRNTVVLILGVFAGCISMIHAEDLRSSSSVHGWRSDASIAYTAAWLLLGLSGFGVLLRSRNWIRGGGHVWGVDRQSERSKEEDALRVEWHLSAWCCLVPWVTCLFISHCRASALLQMPASGAAREEAYELETEYGVVLLMLIFLEFCSNRTHMRFAFITMQALSCIVSYTVSSAFLGPTDCKNNFNMWWKPVAVLILIAALVLSGLHSVEYHRRLAFFSMYASHAALKEVCSGDLDSTLQPGADMKFNAVNLKERSDRFGSALEMLKRSSESVAFGNRPCHAALQSVVEVLQDMRKDVVEKERWLPLDVGAELRQRCVTGKVKDLLILQFNVPESREERTSSRCQIDSAADSSSVERWGWDVLSPSSPVNALLEACESLILPSAREAGTDLESRTRQLIGHMLRTHDQGPKHASDHAALSVHAAHWLSRQTGLWKSQQPWERVALLIASASSRCGCNSLFFGNPVLDLAARMNFMVGSLDKVGFDKSCISPVMLNLKGLVCRVHVRLQPQLLLDDIREFHRQMTLDSCSLTSSSARELLTGIVVGAADLAWLVLPSHMHKDWATLCKRDLVANSIDGCSHTPMWEESMDTACWFTAYVEILVLPLFEALKSLPSAEGKFEPLFSSLRQNANVYTHARRLETRSNTRDPCLSLPGEVEGDLVDML